MSRFDQSHPDSGATEWWQKVLFQFHFHGVKTGDWYRHLMGLDLRLRICMGKDGYAVLIECQILSYNPSIIAVE